MPQTARRSVLTSRPRVTYSRPRNSFNGDQESAELPKAATDKKPLRGQTSISTPSASEEQQKSLCASHELHEAGRSHRFQDALEYLLEGIQEKERLQVRRTSCLELTRSLLNQDFTMHVLVYGHWPAISGVLIQSQDPIIIACCAVMMAILAQKPEAYNSLCETRHLLDFLLIGLDLEQDPFAVMSNRRDAASINTLKEVVQESGIIPRGQRVLVSSLLLIVLASLTTSMVSHHASHKRLASNVVNEEILIMSLDLLIMDMAWLKQAAESPMSLSDIIDLGRVNSVLQILEDGSRVSNVVPKVLAARPKFFQIMTQLLVLSRAHAFQGGDRSDAATLMGHTLRLLVNVSHESEVCCEMLAQHDAVSVLTVNIIQLYRHCRQHLHFGKGRHGQSEDDTQDWYDILLLSVGLVINMLEKNAASRSKFLHSAIKLGCPGIGPCFHGNCDCAKSDQALEKIIEIYKPESDAQVEGNMLPAYLAVLIVRIVEDDANGQERLAQAVGDSGLEEMRLLLENFGLMYNAMLETIVERVICDSEDNALASKKENIHTDRMRQTFRSILNTTRVLTNIQNSRMV